MKTKWKIFGVAAVVAGVVAFLLSSRQPVITEKAQLETPAVPVAQAPPASPLAPEDKTVPDAQPVKTPIVESSPKLKPASPTLVQNQTPKPPKEPLHDPDARDALALVGVDPAAEQYWMEAIYDTSLPDNEREDLMEDLNEVGFADPKNVTANDLPLIANRLLIIEELLPNVDDFMKEHLLEAGKDLSVMADKAK